jgi:hypothetical protein
VPVLASPSAAAMLGSAATQLNSLPDGAVQGAGRGHAERSTPAQPGGGAFVVMPLLDPARPGRPPAPNMVLVTGSSIDDRQLTAVASR